MEINGLKIQNYLYHFIKEIKMSYEFQDKTILFFNMETNQDIPKYLIELGAKKVYYVSYLDDNCFENTEKIQFLNFDERNLWSNIEDNSIDLVVCIEILEHINLLNNFFEGLKRTLKDNSSAILQGHPMWTSQYGHHIWIEDKYYFTDSSNPFLPWEHLSYETKEEFKNALWLKDISEEDSNEIISFIYNPNEISRHTPSEIFEAATGGMTYAAHKFYFQESASIKKEIFRTKDFVYCFERYFDDTDINIFYDYAKEKYSEDDLKTIKCTLKIKKIKQSDFQNKQYEIPELHHALSDIVLPFSEKNDIRGKRVLNISNYENEILSEFFRGAGATEVIAISPSISFEKSFYQDEVIVNNRTSFEDYDFSNVEKFDIIFGLDVLQHIKNIDTFCKQLKKISDFSTAVYIAGYMPYTNACGHLLSSEHFGYWNETNPLEYWQHLSLNSEDELRTILMSKGIPYGEVNYMIQNFFNEQNLLKLQPSKIENKIHKYFPYFIKRIFKYLPKNEYYNKALTKYTEDDLNTERMIISTDYPVIEWFDELNLNPYIIENLSDINEKYNIKGKRVLNISPFINPLISDAFNSFFPKEIVSICSNYSGYELKGGKNIISINQNYEDLENISGKFDIIYGMDILEHIKDLKKFFENLRNLIDDNGVICVKASPLWPSYCGHNYFKSDLDCGILKTGYEEGLSLQPWEHLYYETKEDFKTAMKNRGFTEHDAERVSEYTYNSNEINRLSFKDILNILNSVDGIVYGMRKVLNYLQENEFYKKASEKYSHEELRMLELYLFIRKKR
jgi:2-polyprenyl-3-methyl-5-hydroxy-6-metoxy-1,4-benzoquinol methylase